jgi:hypothetical protein
MDTFAESGAPSLFGAGVDAIATVCAVPFVSSILHEFGEPGAGVASVTPLADVESAGTIAPVPVI